MAILKENVFLSVLSNWVSWGLPENGSLDWGLYMLNIYIYIVYG